MGTRAGRDYGRAVLEELVQLVPAVRLSDAVEPRRLHHTQLDGELLHRSGAEYGISI